MDAGALFTQGDLQGAIEAVTREVKSRPMESRQRTFLFELLCFAGDFDRASRQLDVIEHQDVMAEPAVQVYRNILHAEHLRHRLLSDNLRPEFLLDPPVFVRLHLEAIERLHLQRFVEAKALLDESDATRTALRGRLDGEPFEGFRDCDDLMAPFLELIVLRDYVWLPLEQIRELELGAPERPRDLLWIPVRVELTNGAQHRGYVPVLYCDSHRHADNRVKLGRLTDWSTVEQGPVLGVGQRMFLAGDRGLTILEARRIQFEAALPM